MLRPRIFPVLLLENGNLIKTRQFKDPKYVGDPINAVRIYNDFKVDELAIFNLDYRSGDFSMPLNWKLLESISNECRMPVMYGGGVRDLITAKRLVSLGFEKVSVSKAFLENPVFVGDLSKEIGAQSVVVTLDCRKLDGDWYVYGLAGVIQLGLLSNFLEKIAHLDIGELVLNVISSDGMMDGGEIDLISSVEKLVNVPISITGGVNSLDCIIDYVNKYGSIGLGVGSYFIFKGKFRAVMPSYLSQNDRNIIAKKMNLYYEK